MKAEAWHHRSDALSSIGALAGIAGARLGFKMMDPLAGFVISLFIIKASADYLLHLAVMNIYTRSESHNLL